MARRPFFSSFVFSSSKFPFDHPERTNAQHVLPFSNSAVSGTVSTTPAEGVYKKDITNTHLGGRRGRLRQRKEKALLSIVFIKSVAFQA